MKIAGRPAKFYGTIRLPPSKSYLHRALFAAALCTGSSSLMNCGVELNQDIQATISCLNQLDVEIRQRPANYGTLLVTPGKNSVKEVTVNAQASGTTARFIIPFAALSKSGSQVRIIGDQSLAKRPMRSIFEALAQLGVTCRSENSGKTLPIIVEGGGIKGGECEVDGSVSSQFVSSLLLSCTRADEDTIIHIRNPEKQVSEPYIEATIKALKFFGFKIDLLTSKNQRFDSFKIKGNQIVPGKKRFAIPGDMSSAASLLCSALASNGELTLSNFGDGTFPQPDSAIVPIASRFGGKIARRSLGLGIKTDGVISKEELTFDLGDSPDLVPAIAGVSAATGSHVHLVNIGHLRFKESDRLAVLSRELGKIGVVAVEKRSSLEIKPSRRPGDFRKPILLDPEKDHRILIALTIAGLSGRFGELHIQDPDCVKKSYPDFVSDLQKACHEKSTVAIIQT
ncbi:MAG: 3-phosphoshikimate 1-carboxyvinyltransferase [Thaumarchaeota archaeon]|nr:3-phosphoshikimate 1-carboxyvinyltransferase [Nitrososphaerota archaeon]